ncbi:MAG: TraR/DksA C4-type zinc finger protein [Pseudomonadota bacterium]
MPLAKHSLAKRAPAKHSLATHPIATHAAARDALEARLALLLDQQHKIEVELDSHHNPDWAELAQEREGDEVLERQGVAGQAEIAAIRSALARVVDGSYGACVRCGDDIAPARLAVLPHTPLCAACAGARKQ